LHALDRQQFSEVHGGELTPAADSWLHPAHPLRGQLGSAIPQYPFDPARALGLLAEAGWTRGPDGKLVHQSGERFESHLRTRSVGGGEQDGLVLQNSWSEIGAQIGVEFMSAALSQDRHYQARAPLGTLSNLGMNHYTEGANHSNAMVEANQPGQNWGHYANPRNDALLDRIVVTIDQNQQIENYRQLLQVQVGDLAFIPLYWSVDPDFVLKGVALGWNVFHWNKE
jgi:peptide/nickel transport system substrate-binding protein